MRTAVALRAGHAVGFGEAFDVERQGPPIGHRIHTGHVDTKDAAISAGPELALRIEQQAEHFFVGQARGEADRAGGPAVGVEAQQAAVGGDPHGAALAVFEEAEGVLRVLMRLEVEGSQRGVLDDHRAEARAHPEPSAGIAMQGDDEVRRQALRFGPLLHGAVGPARQAA